MNSLSDKQDEISEQDKYIYLLGRDSNYHNMEFESFIDYYSFKIDGDTIVVLNDDAVAWEDYTNNDFSYLPKILLVFNGADLKDWIENEVDRQLKKQEQDKLSEKEDIKRQIELLKKKLERL